MPEVDIKGKFLWYVQSVSTWGPEATDSEGYDLDFGSAGCLFVFDDEIKALAYAARTGSPVVELGEAVGFKDVRPRG